MQALSRNIRQRSDDARKARLAILHNKIAKMNRVRMNYLVAVHAPPPPPPPPPPPAAPAVNEDHDIGHGSTHVDEINVLHESDLKVAVITQSYYRKDGSTKGHLQKMFQMLFPALRLRRKHAL